MLSKIQVSPWVEERQSKEVKTTHDEIVERYETKSIKIKKTVKNFADWLQGQLLQRTLQNMATKSKEEMPSLFMEGIEEDQKARKAAEDTLTLGISQKLGMPNTVTKKLGQKLLKEVIKFQMDELIFITCLPMTMPLWTYDTASQYVNEILECLMCAEVSLHDDSIENILKAAIYGEMTEISDKRAIKSYKGKLISQRELTQKEKEKYGSYFEALYKQHKVERGNDDFHMKCLEACKQAFNA